MTTRARLRAARLALTSSVLLSALLWGLALPALVLALAALADWMLGIPRDARTTIIVLSIILGTGAALRVLWRGRRARSESRVALWLEERDPSLRYALVTLVDPHTARPEELERSLARADLRTPVRRAVTRALLPPALLLAVMAALLLMLPKGVIARVTAPRSGDALDRAAPPAGTERDPLATVVVLVSPPAYSGEEEHMLENPSTVRALTGSRLTIRGAGADVSARLGDRDVSVRSAADRWSLAIEMPARAAALRLRSSARERLLVLEPRPDSAPAVTLGSPARDTVFRAPMGRLALAGSARDDIALLAGWFEVIVSSGEGESFTFRTLTLGRRALARTRQAELSSVLSLDSLALRPGDILHVRAVARDGNTVAGPGVGSSETRTIRVARAGEYDSVAVEGAPPPDADKSEVSQRMLIMLAEALERRRPRLARESILGESRRIGVDQARLRRRVSEIIFTRLEGEEGEHSHAEEEQRANLSPDELLRAAEEASSHVTGEALDFAEGESPVIAVNRPMLEAYNAMWDAGRELDIGEPARALPHMRAALDAIQRARAAERIYLRGRPPTAVVDLQKVRLAGDRAGAAPRAAGARVPDDDPVSRVGARLDQAMALLPRAPDAAVDSLLLLRVEMIERAPSLAAALADAIDALRARRDATDALTRARRAALGAPASRPGVPAWGGAW